MGCVVRHTFNVATDDKPGSRRRGRPPATDSAATREAILAGARKLFGERGFGPVTNKDLAAAAGITTGALYHYVESKLDLYLEVNRDMQSQIYEQFQKAEASEHTFIGKLEAVLEAAHVMNKQDPTLARFVGVVRTDIRRHPEIRERLHSSDERREEFFLRLVDCGTETGEIKPEHRPLVRAFVSLILVGLTEGNSSSIERHRRAIDSVLGVLRGELVSPPPEPAG
jgi:AcrR family transcriptional regulator